MARFSRKTAMPFIKVMVHYVWATKSWHPSITPALKPLLLNHIKENSLIKGIYINSLNCVSDHIHLLVSLSAEQTLARVAMLIKGESSFWVNKQKILPHKFEWQDDYYAGSVSPSLLSTVQAYIGNQEEHHKKKTFQEEVQEIVDSFGPKAKGLG